MQRNVKMLIVVLDEYFSNLTHLCEQHACPRREHLQMPSLYPHQTVPTPTGDHQQHGFVQTFFVLQVKPFFCVGFIYLFIWWGGNYNYDIFSFCGGHVSSSLSGFIRFISCVSDSPVLLHAVVDHSFSLLCSVPLY